VSRTYRFVKNHQALVSVIVAGFLATALIFAGLLFIGIFSDLQLNVSETTLNLLLGGIYFFGGLAVTLYCLSTSSDKTSW
jgi:hypothetical protein